MKVEPIVYLNINGTVSLIPRTADIFSIDDFETINAEYFSFKYYQSSADTFIKCVSNSFLKNFTKPFILITDSFGIPQFSKLKFNRETVDILNKDGLHIFINEPLVKYTGHRRIIDKSNLNASTLKDFEFTDARFEMTDYAITNLKSLQLDSITDLINTNNLSNVSVYTPDYNAGIFFSKNYPAIKLYCQDVFLSEFVKEIALLPNASKTAFTYKFLSTNWRYASHRHLIMSYMIHCSGKYSWYYNGTFDQLNNSLWFNLNQWPPAIVDKIKAGLDLLNKSTPINLDFTVSTPVSIEGHFGDWLLLPSYDTKPFYTSAECFDNVFCAVVNECDFPDPTSNISEKTLLAIKYNRPFIIAGQPGSLAYAKLLGFKTFDKFWDEGYDLETNHEQRLLKIFKVIDYIESLDFEQLEEMYKEMLPIIEHNYNNLILLADSETWPVF